MLLYFKLFGGICLSDPRFKSSDATRDYYKDSLSLIREDLLAEGGFDEILASHQCPSG
jgi:hypothetical protein